MTPGQKRIVQETWHSLVPIADTAAELFYDRLFEVDPTTRLLFAPENPRDQRRKLLQVLAAAVRGLDDLNSLVPVVEDLGRRHARYGVTEKHYESVGNALLWTLEQGLGPVWTVETRAAWSEVYGLLSGIMQRAAASPSAIDATDDVVSKGGSMVSRPAVARA